MKFRLVPSTKLPVPKPKPKRDPQDPRYWKVKGQAVVTFEIQVYVPTKLKAQALIEQMGGLELVNHVDDNIEFLEIHAEEVPE